MIIKCLSKPLLFIALFIGSCLNTFAQPAAAEEHIRQVMKDLDAVGLSVAVVKNNKLIYTHAFGLNNIETNTPLQENDIFRIASISKSFSATAVMQLIEAGKLSLDDDFGKLVGFKVRNPAYPDQVITLKMAMSHTSSLNDSQGYLNLDVINPEKNPNWAKCYSPVAPGSKYDYCNLNYNMIGAIIEKLSGERFDNYIKNHVLRPLGLNAGYNVDSLDKTKFVMLYEYDSATKKFTAAPVAYEPRREQIRNYTMGYSTPIFSPTGGMKISAPDLARYMMMHMNYGKYPGGRLMSKKHSRIMQTKVQDEEGYGLAIRSLDGLVPGTQLKGHTGSAYGLYSAMFFNPKKKYGFVVITNGSNSVYFKEGIRTILWRSMESLYQDFIQ